MRPTTRPLVHHDLLFVVDDEPALQFTLGRKLERAGFKVETFPSPQPALEQMNTRLPILVISDLVMPEITGLEFLRTMRERYGAGTPAFILITAYSSTESAREALRLGATDYLLKPFNPNLLVDRVHHAIHAARLYLDRELLRAVLADDLRAQLGALEMTLHALERGDAGPLSPEQQELIRLARTESGRMHRLVHNLDDLHLLSEKRLHNRPARLRFDQIWRQAREHVHTLWIEPPETLRLTLETEAGEGGVRAAQAPWIRADRDLALRLCECLLLGASRCETATSMRAELRCTPERLRVELQPWSSVPNEPQWRHAEALLAPSARKTLLDLCDGFNPELELSLAQAIAETLGGRLRFETNSDQSALVLELPTDKERAHG